MQGFIVGTLAAGLEADFARDVGALVAGGALRVAESVTDGGVEAAPAAFLEMMRGGNVGKAVVRVSKHDPYPVAAAAPAPA